MPKRQTKHDKLRQALVEAGQAGLSAEEIIEKLDLQDPRLVRTYLTDLCNPKYCGQGGPLRIEVYSPDGMLAEGDWPGYMNAGRFRMTGRVQ